MTVKADPLNVHCALSRSTRLIFGWVLEEEFEVPMPEPQDERQVKAHLGPKQISKIDSHYHYHHLAFCPSSEAMTPGAPSSSPHRVASRFLCPAAATAAHTPPQHLIGEKEGRCSQDSEEEGGQS